MRRRRLQLREERHSRAQILVSSRPSPDEGGPLEYHNNDWHYYVYSLDRYSEDLHVASLSHSLIFVYNYVYVYTYPGTRRILGRHR